MSYISYYSSILNIFGFSSFFAKKVELFFASKLDDADVTADTSLIDFALLLLDMEYFLFETNDFYDYFR